MRSELLEVVTDAVVALGFEPAVRFAGLLEDTLPGDVVLATMWAAGLAGTTQVIARTIPGVPDPYGLVAGALGAGLIALLCAASRGVAATPMRA